MMKSQCLSFLAILFSLSACAPINYEATYRPPSGHVSAYRSPQAYTRPIQVTLYSDSTYLDINFKPILIVISDGEYVEIPVKNRRGRSSRIFAHYNHGNLHFDGNRKCQKIHGSTGYQYDRRWDKGYKYAYVNAGREYDFTGLRLVIRNAPKANSRPRQVLTPRTPTVHKKTLITEKYHSVKDNNKKSNNKKIVDYNQLKNVKRKAVVAIKTSKPKKHLISSTHVNAKDKFRVIGNGKPEKLVVPEIVREVSRHNKASINAVTVRKSISELSDKPASNRSVASQVNHLASGIKRQQTNSQRKSVHAAPGVYKAIKDKSMKGGVSVSKKAKEVESVQKNAARAQGQKQLTDKARNQQGAPGVFVVAHPQGRDKLSTVKKGR